MAASSSFFCEECGAANLSHSSVCFACSTPLVQSSLSSSGQMTIQVLPVPAVSSPTITLRPGVGSLLHKRYKLVREIGQGGFGVVYLARDMEWRKQRVAVKQINIGQLSVRESIDATDSYNREVTLLSKLKHPHLPRFYDHFTDPEHWYLVMEYIQGQTLDEYMQAEPGRVLSLKKAITVGIQLCNVLNYLHSQTPPIIFRDIKPANIMQTPRGKIYLIDFGIARRFDSRRIKDTGSLGSPGYAAPEQYGKAQTTIHTDIYGLGATLQTLVTGKEPLDPQAGVPPHSSSSRLQRKFYRLVDQMLEKESSKRPQTIQKVKESLERLQSGRQARSFLWGFLLGIAPYALFLFVILASQSTAIDSFIYLVLVALYCCWPFIFIAQLIASLVLVLEPHKRLVGLGILAGLMLFGLALLFHQEQLSVYLRWLFFGGS